MPDSSSFTRFNGIVILVYESRWSVVKSANSYSPFRPTDASRRPVYSLFVTSEHVSPTTASCIAIKPGVLKNEIVISFPWDILSLKIIKQSDFVCLANGQWLELDIGHPTLVTGLVTKGKGDTQRNHWVTKYKVSFSNDSVLWTFYKDANHLEPKVISTW